MNLELCFPPVKQILQNGLDKLAMGGCKNHLQFSHRKR